MGMFELVGLLSSKDGDELFDKVSKTLNSFGIATADANGKVRSLYDVLCDVADVWNGIKGSDVSAKNINR